LILDLPAKLAYHNSSWWGHDNLFKSCC
jgi:hypothetical protein